LFFKFNVILSNFFIDLSISRSFVTEFYTSCLKIPFEQQQLSTLHCIFLAAIPSAAGAIPLAADSNFDTIS
jgi:hypothetical protein